MFIIEEKMCVLDNMRVTQHDRRIKFVFLLIMDEISSQGHIIKDLVDFEDIDR